MISKTPFSRNLLWFGNSGNGGVAEEGEKDPTSFRLLTQRALLAHGVLVLERVVGELRGVVRGRVTVAGRPVEGDCAVSC